MVTCLPIKVRCCGGLNLNPGVDVLCWELLSTGPNIFALLLLI